MAYLDLWYFVKRKETKKRHDIFLVHGDSPGGASLKKRSIIHITYLRTGADIVFQIDGVAS